MTRPTDPNCQRCGEIIHLGEARVGVQLTPDELVELALATSDDATARKLLCALGLLDVKRELQTASERPWQTKP